MCDLAESRLVGTAMRCLIRNTHKIRSLFLFVCLCIFCYIPRAATAVLLIFSCEESIFYEDSHRPEKI